MMESSKFSYTAENDRLYEGFRIPALLDNTTSVNFVLTQEAGKLKPKDLKLAIERNRAEKEIRAEEQKKLRDEGGGAGILDIRGILAEEKLNSVDSDPFKRQLREMAFLADVEDVEKQEKEKEFRITEDFLGSHFLSQEDIAVVYKQRSRTALHKKRSDWRIIQSRQHTETFPPTHTMTKAGAAAQIAKQIRAEIHPMFDSNRNDIWAKRMNTLRQFISAVSKYIIRKRVGDRMKKFIDFLHDNGAHTRQAVRQLIESENVENSKQGGGAASTSVSGKERIVDFKEESPAGDDQRPVSVAVMVFASENEILLRRQKNEAAVAAAAVVSRDSGGSEVTSEMARRILFPRCVPSSSGGKNSRKELTPEDIRSPLSFDDRTFFSLKVRPEYITMGYKPHALPPVPLYFPPSREKSLRTGAPEETALRSSADASTSVDDVRKLVARETSIAIPPHVALLLKGKSPTNGEQPTLTGTVPSWLSADPVWTAKEVDFFTPRPEYRVFVSAPRRCEMDADWALRPDSEPLNYSPDPSIRTSWCSRPGFLSANVYLLGSQESRNRDLPPPPGPTLSDYYMPDQDRHRSGLHCYARERMRGTLERDPDISALQNRQDKADYLTDSESDNEDGYGSAKPSMQRVKQILQAPPKKEPVVAVDPKLKGKAPPPSKKPAAAAVTTPVVSSPSREADHESFSILGEQQRREEQVELLRDRKILDLESTWTRARQQQFDTISDQLVELSQKSQCLVQALPVQVPFHRYEDQVYKLMAERLPEPSSVHVEIDPRASLESLSATLQLTSAASQRG